jgi:leader peptidase (prepilin peptidase)/N-methyltransferase
MGFGDVKLAIFMGLFLGYPKIMVAFYLAFILGAIVGVTLLVTKIIKRKQPIPFGPFLIAGMTLAYFYGEKIMYYFSRWL